MFELSGQATEKKAVRKVARQYVAYGEALFNRERRPEISHATVFIPIGFGFSGKATEKKAGGKGGETIRRVRRGAFQPRTQTGNLPRNSIHTDRVWVFRQGRRG